jgi:hypothetical protein
MRLAGLGAKNDGVVKLNVYDLHENNEALFQFGLGMFHSGVQLSKSSFDFVFWKIGT